MITQPTNNQQSVHKNHLKQKGLATQGRGLDNEDLPCFRRQRVVSAVCGNVFKVPTKHILRNSVQCAEPPALGWRCLRRRAKRTPWDAS